MDFITVLRPEIMNLQLNAENKKEALERLAELLLRDGAITSVKDYMDDILLREAQGVTGMGNYIAIPHGKSNTVQKVSVAVGKLVEPIEWETLDENPVKLIFLFAVPKNEKDNEHLKLLSQLATVLARDKSQEALLNATTPEQVLDIFGVRSESNHLTQ